MDRREKLEYVAGKKIVSVADILILAVIALVVVGVFFLVPKKAGAAAEVYSDGRLVARLPLSADASVTVRYEGGYNVVRVSGGKVYVSEASCSDHTCMGFGKLSRTGERIVCLPNRLVVKIVGGEDSGLDGVVG